MSAHNFLPGYVVSFLLTNAVVPVPILSCFLPAATYKLQKSINLWVVMQGFLRSSTFTTAGSQRSFFGAATVDCELASV